ncbi:hypothetical protein B0H19DRAFT_1072779 [Mycena capillaripes]|nr:hypothetical protein B0H19DRAFT_1072779 [Mycena capillaripes]
MAVVATRDGRRRRRAPSRTPPINPIKVPAPSAELARLGAILKTVTELAESDPEEYEHLMALEVALRKIHSPRTNCSVHECIKPDFSRHFTCFDLHVRAQTLGAVESILDLAPSSTWPRAVHEDLNIYTKQLQGQEMVSIGSDSGLMIQSPPRLWFLFGHQRGDGRNTSKTDDTATHTARMKCPKPQYGVWMLVTSTLALTHGPDINVFTLEGVLPCAQGN